MTERQWQALVAAAGGDAPAAPPIGFIIDSPWLPGWCGRSMLDYYTSDEAWLDCNLAAQEAFPEVLFLPGFWSEFGMCTEPSAFGGRSVWSTTELPHHEAILDADLDGLAALPRPDVGTDGLLPLALHRLRRCEPRIREAGHAVRFAVSRGPLNIASFLMGTTELMMATQLCPERVHDLLDRISLFVTGWLELQLTTFPSIGGVLLLDDLIGFLGEDDFDRFALPYLARVYGACDVPIRFLHNDAAGIVTGTRLARLGVNLFNFSHNHSLSDMRAACGPSVCLLGNLPPRDVLAVGAPDDVAEATAAMTTEAAGVGRVILSCGGGMPPGVPTDNIRAFCRAAHD